MKNALILALVAGTAFIVRTKLMGKDPKQVAHQVGSDVKDTAKQAKSAAHDTAKDVAQAAGHAVAS